VSFEQSSFTVDESEDLSIRINLNRILTVPVDVQVRDNPPSEVRIPAGATAAIFQFPVSDNNICNDNITIPLVIVPLTANCVAGDPGRATVTIIDDDGEWWLTLFQ